MATMLLLGITLVAGFAMFGYVREQAGVSELSYAQSVGGTLSLLQEKFVVPLVTFTTSSATVYVYTSGQVPTQLVQVELFGPSRSAMDVVYTSTQVTVSKPSACAGQTAAGSSNESPMLGQGTGSLSVNVNDVSTIKLTLPTCTGLTFQSGTTYVVELLGIYGNTATYSEVM